MTMPLPLSAPSRPPALPARRAALALGCGALALWTGRQAHAQSVPATGIDGTRNFPAASRLGELVIGFFPEASLDGQATRFSAAGQLLDTENRILVPSGVYGQTLLVRYELDSTGAIRRAWLLNEAELQIARDEAARRR